MQLISERPAAVVDFAHNTDALARACEAVRPAEEGAKLIVVFGATGQRDQGKRPAMGAIAARLADTVIITDDDPHDEDAAAIRADVLAGAVAARDGGSLPCEILEIHPRDEAIRRAVELAGPQDTILVAGRGHEVWQEVQGVNHRPRRQGGTAQRLDSQGIQRSPRRPDRVLDRHDCTYCGGNRRHH